MAWPFLHFKGATLEILESDTKFHLKRHQHAITFPRQD